MLEYIQANVQPDDQKEARSVVAQAPSFGGMLYFINSQRGNTKRVVVLQSLRNLMMTENHSGLCVGHFS